ncbi:hypothetical protein BKA70DRAFT_1241843 [Coprinopsis sp. MPI-PUGE-AT-0042]|nr:hypothetical protein BKA70DRAFT_1241843 [Coprinopsis sp. MPI-PUGE-AT-0042]
MAETELREAGLTPGHIQERVVHLVAVWLEGFLSGVYLCLFIAALPALIRSNTIMIFSAKVFLIGNVLIFVLVLMTSSIGLFHIVVAFAYQADTNQPIFDIKFWAAYTPLVLAAVIFAIGDILMIYRCFLIWQRNIWAIILPLFLAVLSVGMHIATVWFARHISFDLLLAQTWFPIALAPALYLLQTNLTTGLIVWKIWSQSRRRTDIELASIHVPRLLSIMRIIIESAAIYTAGMLVMLVLLALDHPARVIIHACMLPITGIVFVLMALRIHALREESREMPASPSLMPTFSIDGLRSTVSGTDPMVDIEHSARTRTPLRLPNDDLQPAI